MPKEIFTFFNTGEKSHYILGFLEHVEEEKKEVHKGNFIEEELQISGKQDIDFIMVTTGPETISVPVNPNKFRVHFEVAFDHILRDDELLPPMVIKPKGVQNISESSPSGDDFKFDVTLEYDPAASPVKRIQIPAYTLAYSITSDLQEYTYCLISTGLISNGLPPELIKINLKLGFVINFTQKD